MLYNEVVEIRGQNMNREDQDRLRRRRAGGDVRGIWQQEKVMKDSPTKAALNRAMSRIEQSPSRLRELKALEAVLNEIARCRKREATFKRLLGTVKALGLGSVGIGRSL